MNFNCLNANEEKKNMLTKLSDVRTALNVEIVECADNYLTRTKCLLNCCVFKIVFNKRNV